jgi:UDP-GlcNAc:undecaprenyl-phosphate/decaprenyl-phosphate GlcNAc-1-phosphate transferase
MRSYVTAFVIAAFVSALLTPLVRRAALSMGAVSESGGRHVHTTAIPRLGGVAICLALFLPIIGLLFVESGVAASFKAHVPKVIGLSLGGVVMCGVGMVDDIRGIRALYKLYAQLAVAILAFLCGFRIEAIALPGGISLSMGIFAMPITVLWIVGIVNAVNLIDGLDGLAGGVVFFAGLTNFVVAYLTNSVIAALIMSAMLGAVLGFLFYNFNPARIFMGDSGSYLLGYVMAVTALVGASAKASTAVSLLVPIVALGVPIFDTLFAMVRRILERRPIFAPDRGHVHHRLLDLGITHRRAVLILYGISIIFTVASIGIYLGRSWQVGIALLVATVVVVGLARFLGYFSIAHLRKRQQVRVRSRDTELLRRCLPDLTAQLAGAEGEDAMLEILEHAATEVGLAAMEILAGEELVWSYTGSVSKRRVVAEMTYPIGNDALARARLTVAVINDFEEPIMSPQTDILLQVVADVLANNFVRVGSELAPRTSDDVVEGEANAPGRASAPTLAIKMP